MATSTVDFAQQLLAPVQADADTKAQAWEAYHNAPDLPRFNATIQSLNLPQAVKAELWEGANTRLNGAANAPGVPAPQILQNPQAAIQGNDYEAVPDEQTPQGHAAAIQQRELQGYGDGDISGTTGQILNTALAQPAIGFAKGAGETVNTLTGGAFPETTTSNTTGQSVGKGLEGIAEFVAGDAALQGTSLATKLGLSAKIAKLAEESPTAAKIINAGLNVLRATGVSAGQSALHPGQDESAGDAAIRGAEYGVGGGLIGEGLGAGANYLLKKTPAAIDAAAREGVAKATTDAAEATGKDQFNLQSSMSSVAQRAAEQHGVPWPAEGATGAFWTFNDAAKAIRENAAPVFNDLRQATPITDLQGNPIGNMFDRLTTEIKAAKKVIYGQPSSAKAYLNAETMLKTSTDKLNALFENGAAGRSQAELQAAKSAWSAQATLDDLGDAIDRAYLKTANLRAISPEETPFINPQKFVTNLNNGVRKISANALDNALGKDSISALNNLNDTLQKSASDATALQQTERAVKQAIASGKYGTSAEGKALGTTGSLLSSGAATGLIHMFGGSNPISAGVGLSLGTIHWLYTHPTMGVKILQGAQKAAPAVSQIAKQTVTHIYHPDGSLEKLQPTPQNVTVNADPRGDAPSAPPLLASNAPMPDLPPPNPVVPTLDTSATYGLPPNVVNNLTNLYKAAENNFYFKDAAHNFEHSFVYNMDGNPGDITSSRTGMRNAVAIYPNTAGIVHTHPSIADPRPSQEDITIAKNLNKPNYVLSRDQLWVARPDGTTARIADVRKNKGKLDVNFVPQ